MKSLSIGRDTGCDIIINDDKDLISRRHAILYIYPMGKMSIVDQGQNGTYINGIRITPNVPYPVSRKDTVSFAHVHQLNWKEVPNSFAFVRNIVLGVISIILISVGVYIYYDKKPIPEPKNIVLPVVVDDKEKPQASPDSNKVEDKNTVKPLFPRKNKKKTKKDPEEKSEKKEENEKTEKTEEVKPIIL